MVLCCGRSWVRPSRVQFGNEFHTINGLWKKRMGPSIELCKTPLFGALGLDFLPLTVTSWVLFFKYEVNHAFEVWFYDTVCMKFLQEQAMINTVEGPAQVHVDRNDSVLPGFCAWCSKWNFLRLTQQRSLSESWIAVDAEYCCIQS